MLVFSSSSQTLSGKIDHFYNKPFTLSVHIGDSLIPVQKITTNEKGEFQFDLQNLNNVYATLGKKYGLTKNAMLRIELNRERNQFADVIVQSFYEPSININREIKTRGDKRDIRIHLVYNPRSGSILQPIVQKSRPLRSINPCINFKSNGERYK